jgi:hypothetical protein
MTMSSAVPQLKRIRELCVDQGSSARNVDQPVLRFTVELIDGRFVAWSWRLSEIVPKMAADPTADVTEAYTRFMHGQVIGPNPPLPTASAGPPAAAVDLKSLEKVAFAIRGYIDRGFENVGKVLRRHKDRADDLEERTKRLELK